MTEKNQATPPEEKEPVKVTFSFPQLFGSALAAATVAFVGSSLGTAGTIIGAALASVVGAVAGTLYTAGLDRTGRHLGTVMRRGWDRVRGADPSVDVEPGDGLDLVIEEHDPGTMAPVPSGVVHPAPARTWRVFWLRTAVATLAIFAVAFVAITIFEVTLGRAFDGQPGTTVGQVVRPRPAPSTTQPDPSPSPTATASATPTPQPTVTPSATPTPSVTVAPTPTPTTSVAPTTPPASQPTPTASAPQTDQPVASGQPASDSAA